MSCERGEDGNFYRYAMELFQNTGHAITSEPIYSNHSFEQFVYLDTEDTIVLTKSQRNSFANYANISKLFTLDSNAFISTTNEIIAVYSAVIHSDRSARSQCAFDAHLIIQKADRSDATIVLFKHNNNILVSFMGFGQKVYLSDWFNADDDYLIERMHITNVSIESPQRYYVDFVYNLARDYYTHPVSKEFAKYCSLPDDYFAKSAFDEIDREYVLEEIRKCLHRSEYEYGDDYVPQNELLSYGDISFDKEFTLIMLEMELENNSTVTKSTAVSEERTEKDYYELDNINPELFRDASLMVKWLEKQESKSLENEKDIRPTPHISFERAKKPEPQFDALRKLISDYELEPVNKVFSGGALWFEAESGDETMKDFAFDCSAIGCPLQFAKDAKALKHGSGWFLEVKPQYMEAFRNAFKQDSEKKEDSHATNAGDDLVLTLVKESGFEYIDKRDKKGGLWIIASEEEAKEFVKKCKSLSIIWAFAPNGSRSTKHRPGWYCR